MEGKYTFIGRTGSSVVDYVLASPNLFQYIDTLRVHEPNILSDHCLIDFSFSFNGTNTHSETHASTTHQAYTYAWNSENKTSYTEMFNSEIFIEKLNVWVDSVDNCCSANDIDVCITHFGDIFDDVLSPLFKRQHRSQGQEYFPSKIDKRWFNAECAEKRTNFYRHLNIFRNNKTEENKRNFIDARTQFKTCIENQNLNTITMKLKSY